MSVLPNQRLVRIAVYLLREGCTDEEVVKMLGVLVSRKNKVDSAPEIVRSARLVYPEGYVEK